MTIRQGTYLDFSQILFMLVSEMHQEADLDLPEVDVHKTSEALLKCLREGVVLVSEQEDGSLAGSIGGIVTSDWYSSKELLGDYWFYVREPCRGGSHAMKLLTEFRKRGKELGVSSTRVGHFYGGDLDGKDKLYEKAGYTKVGAFFAEGM